MRLLTLLAEVGLAEHHELYYFLRLNEDEGLGFEVFEGDDGWYWHPRPHFSRPGETHGLFATRDEAYQDAVRSPSSRIKFCDRQWRELSKSIH